MGKGKRYSGKIYGSSRGGRRGEELNYKKIVIFFIVILLIVVFAFGIKMILDSDNQRMQTANIQYFTLYKDDKWGVIDSLGEIVISPLYDEMIQIPNNKKPVFICTYDVNYENDTYKAKAVDAENNQIFKKYSKVEAIDNYSSNNEFWYEDNILRVADNEKYGLINLNGKEILKLEYEEVTALKGIKGRLLIKKDNKYGVCDLNGTIIIQPEYKEIKATKDSKYGYVIIDKDGKSGYISGTGEKLIAPVYEDLSIITAGPNTYLKFKKDSKYGVLDLKNTITILSIYDDIKQESGENTFIVKLNNTWKVIDSDDNILLQDYQDITYAFDNNYIVKENNKFGITNLQKQVKLANMYDSIVYRKEAGIIECENASSINTKVLNKEFTQIAEGIITNANNDKFYFRMRVNEEFKYYTFDGEEKTNTSLLNNDIFLSKKEGKYGYINKQGDVIVDYIYDDATEQNEYGFASVKKNGLWGSIDKEGKVVVEPKYNLDNNLSISFIGKWHIGSDVGAVFYTDGN